MVLGVQLDSSEPCSTAGGHQSTDPTSECASTKVCIILLRRMLELQDSSEIDLMIIISHQLALTALCEETANVGGVHCPLEGLEVGYAVLFGTLSVCYLKVSLCT